MLNILKQPRSRRIDDEVASFGIVLKIFRNDKTPYQSIWKSYYQERTGGY